jgi:hypothetical protein
VRHREHDDGCVELRQRTDARSHLHVDARGGECALGEVTVQLLQRHGRVANVGRARILQQPDLEDHRCERERRALGVEVQRRQATGSREGPVDRDYRGLPAERPGGGRDQRQRAAVDEVAGAR